MVGESCTINFAISSRHAISDIANSRIDSLRIAVDCQGSTGREPSRSQAIRDKVDGILADQGASREHFLASDHVWTIADLIRAE